MHNIQHRIPRFGGVPASLALAAFLLAGCAPKPKLLPEARTPENVLDCALENQVEFQTLACLLKLRLEGAQEKFSGVIEFFYREPGTFCFYPRTFFGIGAFKATGKEDSLTIYFPKQNEFYRGSFSDFQQTELWGWNVSLDVLLEMILQMGGLKGRPVKYAGREGDAFRYDSQDEDWARTYWIDPARCRLTKSRWSHQEKSRTYEIRYKDFRARDHREVPGVINVSSQPEDRVTLKFLERKFNIPIPADKFELEIPPDAKRITFKTREK